MKKGLIILFLAFILCGCSAEYEFSINDTLNENIFIYDSYNNLEQKLKTDEDMNNAAFELTRFERGYDFYHPQRKYTDENKDKIGYTYSMEHNISEFDATSIIRKCYDDINIKETNDFIEIKTTEKFLCFDLFKELDNAYITFNNIDDKKIESNADSIDDEQYKWNIIRKNSNIKPIELKIYKNETNSTKKSSSGLSKIIIPIIIIILLIIIITKILNKTKDNNKI